MAALRQKVKQMEEEVIKLRNQQLQQAVLKRASSSGAEAAAAAAARASPDARSVLLHNVHFSATPGVVAAHFSG